MEDGDDREGFGMMAKKGSEQTCRLALSSRRVNLPALVLR